jgi:signal transduction histidine kinase
METTQAPVLSQTFDLTIPTPRLELLAALRKVKHLDGLTDAEYEWLADHGTERKALPGTVVFQEGEPATQMTIMLKGEVHVRRDRSGPAALFIGRSGVITGLIPFSRMKAHGGQGSTAGNTWVLDIHKDLFPEMLQVIPSMGQRCVSVLLDRVREVTRMEQQAEKLAALGKLAGNLSHELNNPASAAQRSASTLLGELRTYGWAKYQLGSLCLTEEQTTRYRDWEASVRASLPITQGPALSTIDPLQISEREDALMQWLQQHRIPEPWILGPTFAEAGVVPEHLDALVKVASPEIVPAALAAFASSLRAERMTEAVLDSTARIFDLIRAIKDYSYMDQAPIQEIDLAQGLENTLLMLNSRLQQVTVERDYDPELPPLSVYGSELNQVWTALIENALDAMEDHGTLRLQTHLSGQMALIEVHDTGFGIPADIRNRIFEPFFTTKAPGSGLGLGLDAAMRIVQKHRGFISVESRPGATCFQVRLPLNQLQAY